MTSVSLEFNSEALQQDVHLASSALQKALRRADAVQARLSAKSLLRMDANRFWRRLMVIIFEDFGLTDLCGTSEAVTLITDKKRQANFGGANAVCDQIVTQLLTRHQDRRVDRAYMLGVTITKNSNVEQALAALKCSSDCYQLLAKVSCYILRCEQILPKLGVRAVLAAKCDEVLASGFAKGWIDLKLYKACLQARRTTQCLLPVLLPLLVSSGELGSSEEEPAISLTPAVIIDGYPSYAIDGFTRPGRAALALLLDRSPVLRSAFKNVPNRRGKIAGLGSLLFDLEGGLCRSEPNDALSLELKRLSTGCWSGLTGLQLEDALSEVRMRIPDLNEFRADVLRKLL